MRVPERSVRDDDYGVSAFLVLSLRFTIRRAGVFGSFNRGMWSPAPPGITHIALLQGQSRRLPRRSRGAAKPCYSSAEARITPEPPLLNSCTVTPAAGTVVAVQATDTPVSAAAVLVTVED